MRARNVLLTHFSSRYPHMISHNVDKRTEGPTVALAFDHAQLRVGDLWRMPLYLPAIEKSFRDTSEDDEEEEERAVSAAAQLG